MKRLLPFIILILLLIAGICSIPFLLRPESHRTEITSALSQRLKRQVVIGPITMGYWPPSLRLTQVGVMNEAGSPVLQIDGVTAPLDWGALFHLHLVPTGIQLTHPVLSVSRNENGNWGIGDWMSGASGLAETKSWPVERVAWTAGEVHAVDHYAPAPQELVLGSMEGSWDLKGGALTTSGTFQGIASPARLVFSAKGQFFSTPQWSGDIQLADQSNTGSFHVELQSGALDIKGSAPQWRLANALALFKFYARGTASSVDTASPLVLELWQLHVHSSGGHLTVEHTARLAGGLTEMTGGVDSQGAAPLAHGNIALKDVPAEAVLSALGESIPVNGKVTALVKDVQVSLSSHTLSTLKGQGYAELKDGRYKVPQVSLQKLAKAKSMAYAKKKFPDLEEKGIPLTRLSAHWQAKGGILEIQDGLLVSTDLKAGWAGQVDAARQGLDGFLRLEIHEKNPQLASLVPAKYRTQPAYGRLQGTWQEWSLRAVPGSKVPAAIQSKLRKATGQK